VKHVRTRKHGVADPSHFFAGGGGGVGVAGVGADAVGAVVGGSGEFGGSVSPVPVDVGSTVFAGTRSTLSFVQATVPQRTTTKGSGSSVRRFVMITRAARLSEVALNLAIGDLVAVPSEMRTPAPLYESHPARVKGTAQNEQPARRSPNANDMLPLLQPFPNGESDHSVDILLLPSPSGRRAGAEGTGFGATTPWPRVRCGARWTND
jgi:hypothetical protein